MNRNDGNPVPIGKVQVTLRELNVKNELAIKRENGQNAGTLIKVNLSV